MLDRRMSTEGFPIDTKPDVGIESGIVRLRNGRRLGFVRSVKWWYGLRQTASAIQVTLNLSPSYLTSNWE